MCAEGGRGPWVLCSAKCPAEILMAPVPHFDKGEYVLSDGHPKRPQFPEECTDADKLSKSAVWLRKLEDHQRMLHVQDLLLRPVHAG